MIRFLISELHVTCQLFTFGNPPNVPKFTGIQGCNTIESQTTYHNALSKLFRFLAWHNHSLGRVRRSLHRLGSVPLVVVSHVPPGVQNQEAECGHAGRKLVRVCVCGGI